MKQADNMLGESAALAAALDHLSQLATIQRPVLVLGERGTGKELAAERLHYLSTRWDGPFIKVNCASMADSLLESELFGHEAGAFTGASRLHVGRFERADGGTLLLDEIGTMSPPLQEKLLRLIEYGEFERVGGQRTLRVDVRVVGSTNADLRSMADTQAFRADLLDRLSFDVVHMPALRHRDGDVLLLARHFAVQMSAELTWDQFPGFAPAALEQLRDYYWPGNVRELKNVVERSLHRWADPDRAVEDLIIDPFQNPWAEVERPMTRPSEGGSGVSGAQRPQQPTLDSKDPQSPSVTPPPPSLTPPSGISFRETVNDYEKTLLEEALARNKFNQRRAGEALDLSYDQIRGLVRKHKLQLRKKSA